MRILAMFFSFLLLSVAANAEPAAPAPTPAPQIRIASGDYYVHANVCGQHLVMNSDGTKIYSEIIGNPYALYACNSMGETYVYTRSPKSPNLFVTVMDNARMLVEIIDTDNVLYGYERYQTKSLLMIREREKKCR